VIRRVAFLSLHTCPVQRPGVGNAGGMNVYINELAQTMAGRGIEVVVFTRRTGGDPGVVDVRPGYRVVHVNAGPAMPLPMRDMPALVGDFTEEALGWIDANALHFDLIHSHYWLSGWAGVILKERLGIPLANSFHTLGRIKDLNRRPGEPGAGLVRTMAEEEVIARSDCVIAATPAEFDDLLEHYRASPERLCTSPPGIDHDLFRPGDRAAARTWTGLHNYLGDHPVVLFVGRIQAHKGIDVAIAGFAGIPESAGGGLPHLVVVGGPSGPDGDGELVRLRGLAGALGVADRVHFLPPQPHGQLARFYQAADVLVMPSRSETFGLVAAEAQACGLPVVAAAVGGLRFVVDDGRSGYLVDGHDPAAYADAVTRVLSDPGLALKLSQGGVEFTERFSWSKTADNLVELYRGITGK
jgi:D-inositol-3-phosphate glycosyltransferase